jgi:hypothetical protein
MNGWKVFAIILLIIVILETFLIGYFFKVGMEAIEQETECSINICSEYDAFAYDEYEEVCYCYLNDVEDPVHKEYIG